MKTLPLSRLKVASNEVFETMRVYDGQIFCLSAHVNRLLASAQSAGHPLSVTRSGITREAGRCLKKNGLKDAMLRMVLSDGELRMQVMKPRVYPERLFKKGVHLMTSVIRRPSGHSAAGQMKTRDYLTGVLAQTSRPAGIFDMLHLGQSGHVAEATTSNIFMVKNGQVSTPPLYEGVLGGITRNFVMTLAEHEGLICRETVILRHDLYNADECFLTNTSMEIMPVVCIDGRQIGRDPVGPVTARLRKAFRRAVAENA